MHLCRYLRRRIQRDFAYNMQLPKSNKNKNKVWYFIVHLRNILFLALIVTIIIIHSIVKYHRSKFENYMPTYTHKFFTFKEENYEIPTVAELRRIISEYNTNRTILNKESFGPVKWDTPIIVISTESFEVNLRYLLASLNSVKGIETALVIFSHSYYDENVNRIIRTVDFCKVLQMFYPFSVQSNPSSFPGFSKNDCPRGIGSKAAVRRNCTGAMYPDLHGYYRDPKVSEAKHMWWWTANQVFENLPFSADHEGVVVFLNDDMVFTKDFLYMLLLMQDVTADTFPSADIYSYATPMAYEFYYEDKNAFKIEYRSWNPKLHSEVMGFTIRTWNKLVSHYNFFCFVDEHDWAKSLLHLSLNLDEYDDALKVISTVLPRAYRIGANGFFKDLKVFEQFYQVLAQQIDENQSWFPNYLEVIVDVDVKSPEFREDFDVQLSGGWNDPRDWMLCSNLTLTKIKKVLLDTANFMKNEMN